MRGRNIMMLILAGFLISAAVSASGGGGDVKENTKYFDIKIAPEKSIITPDDVMRINISVTDKETGKPVENAAVTVNLCIYQGHFTETINISTEEGDGVYVVEQKTIKSNLDPILANEKGNGIYVMEKKIDTKAELGGIILEVIVEKDGKVDNVKRVISFMKMNPWIYAVGATLFAVICGLGIGVIFGGTKH